MELPYPYSESSTTQSHVFMPTTPHSSLLENDAEHTIMACFLYTATAINPQLIQDRLALIYGGNSYEYHLLHLSPRAYLVGLPEFLNRAQVLEDLSLWSVQNHIHLWNWDTDVGWNPASSTYKLYLEIHNYPFHLWHPKYFHLLVAGFGLPLYVDDANSTGPDRSTLRITIRCVDPTTVPWLIYINYESKWRECKVALLGWSFYAPRRNAHYRGPSSGGRQTEADWAGVQRTLNVQDNATNRASLYHAHMSWLMAEERSLQVAGQWGHQTNIQRASQAPSYHPQPDLMVHNPPPPDREPPDQSSINRDNPTSWSTTHLREPNLSPISHKKQKHTSANLTSNSVSTEKTANQKGITKTKPKIMWPNMCSLKSLPKRIPHKDTIAKLPHYILQLSLRGQSCFTRPPAKNDILPTVSCIAGKKIRGTFYPITPTKTKIPNPKTNQLHNKNIKQLPVHAQYKPAQLKQNNSILGPYPHPSHHIYPASSITIPLHNPPNHHNPKPTPANNSDSPTHRTPKKETMDPEDEALIRKFSQLQTRPSKVIISASGAKQKNWSLCLKAAVHTDKMVFSNQLENQMRKLWDVQPETSFKQTAKGVYLIELVDKKEYSRVLNGGPWIYRQDLVGIEQCASPEAAATEITKGELWVQYHNMPHDELTAEGLKKLTEKIGIPISDPITGFINSKQFFKIKMQV